MARDDIRNASCEEVAEAARQIEAEARATLAMLPRRRMSHKVGKRKAFKHCVRLNADASFLGQARDVAGL